MNKDDERYVPQITPEEAFRASISQQKMPDLKLMVDHQKGEVVIRATDKRCNVMGIMYLTAEQANDLSGALNLAAVESVLQTEPLCFTCDEKKGVVYAAGGPSDQP